MNKQTDIEQIVTYFQNASEDAVNVMLQVINATVAARFKKAPTEDKKPRQPRKPRGLPSTENAKAQGQQSPGNGQSEGV